jgi:hypothetical protein
VLLNMQAASKVLHTDVVHVEVGTVSATV